MTKEQIGAMALEAYPIETNIYEPDGNIYMRKAWIDAATKVSELMYSEEDVLGAIQAGFDCGLSFDADMPNISLAALVHLKDNYIQELCGQLLPTPPNK